jgi:hypothetical protein
MAIGRRKKRVRQEGLWTPTAALPVGASHPFYQRLNQILDEKKFDEYVEALCVIQSGNRRPVLLKLPVTVLLRRPQWKVFRCPARFRVLVAGRRFGKSYLALAELIRM